MNKALTTLLVICFITACHSAKEKANESINKTGEAIAQGASELVKGVKEGINKAFDSEIQLSDDLKEKGIQTGKIVIDDSTGKENVLSVYVIFNKDFNQAVLVKVLDKNGLEYGRVSTQVTGKKNEARFVDFTFDNRISFESKSRFIFQ